MQKRSNSCGSRNVRMINCRTKQLRCHVPGELSTTKQQTIGTAAYFHQEFVESFDTVGEFRVFLVCERCDHALRGRKAQIIHTIRTTWNRDGNFVALNATATDLYWKEWKLSYQELHEFALYIMSCLRGRHDWETNFESLEVGVRLDIAISKDGRFFVNEITRWYAADFFSLSTLGPPHTQLCSAYATALHEFFS